MCLTHKAERSGYHPHDPGSNYQAGYLLAATMIAIAEAGEAEEAGGELWKLVADQMWGKDMAAALSPGSVLEGGDWDEGWQYGPLAVASYERWRGPEESTAPRPRRP